MRLFLVPLICLWVQLVRANTETYLLSIPYYYNIVPHAEPYIDQQSHIPIRINDTHRYLEDFPIYNVLTYGKYSNVVHINQSHVPTNALNVLYVKVNNYENNAFSSRNVIYWKLCWPSSSPYWFRISHEFMDDDLSLYLVVEYQFEGIPNKRRSLDLTSDVEFLLYGSSLSNWLPLPIELIPIIAYLVDVGILLYRIIPWIIEGYFSV